MIKDQCMWACSCPSNAFWTWLKIMKLRYSFQNIIKHKVVTGEYIFVWFDSWYPADPLVKRFDQRIIYDCACSRWAKLSNFVNNGLWQFPVPVSTDLQVIKRVYLVFLFRLGIPISGASQQIKSILVLQQKKLSEGIRRRICVKWFGSLVTYLEWLLSLGFKRGMLTRKKLKQRGCIQEEECVLCNSAIEEVNHLFFSCLFSKAVWEEVLRRNGTVRASLRWGEEKEKGHSRNKRG